MIINGKEVERNFRQAEQIQNKVNTVNQLPDTAKTEVGKKDLKEINSFFSDNSSNYDGFGISNSTLLTGKNSKEQRKDYYNTFQEMDENAFIHRGLQVIADDCSQKGIDGHVLSVHSDDEEIEEILKNLFFDRINIDKELWTIIFETCKLGDNFYEIIPDSYSNPTMISRIRYLEPDRVNRIEKNGKLAFYTYISDVIDPDNMTFSQITSDKKDEEKVMYKLEPWQIVHFKITNKKFNPYGGSLLYPGVKAFMRNQLLEDGMVVYRIARVPERRVFEIDCGNLPSSEANRYVQKIKDNYRTTQILDDRGNINRTASALALTSDIFVPTREGNGTKITTLQGGNGLSNIDDIKYFRDQILWILNIPPERMGPIADQAGASQGRGSLAMQDVIFSRYCERIQFYIEEALTKIAAIELFFKHKKKADLRNFKIELTPPSNIKELMDLEFLTSKMNLIQAMNGTGLFPKKFILEYVMRLNKKEIDNLVFFKDLETQAAQAAEGNMLGGMGFGGMGGMGGAPVGGETMTPPTGDMSAQPPAASVKTETLEQNLVKIFGKEVLIENAEDFAKLIKAADEYNESLKEDEDIDLTDSEFLKEISEIVTGNKPVDKTNSNSISLIYENELGGLNFDKSELSIYKEPKKKTGPKTSDNFIYEEQTINLKNK